MVSYQASLQAKYLILKNYYITNLIFSVENLGDFADNLGDIGHGIGDTMSSPKSQNSAKKAKTSKTKKPKSPKPKSKKPKAKKTPRERFLKFFFESWTLVFSANQFDLLFFFKEG